MGDHRIFVDNLRFTYEGPFVARELFRTIGNYLYDKGYDKKQLKESDIMTPTGKCLEYNLGNWKKITDYMRFELPIRIMVFDLTKREMMVDGRKTMVDYGKVLIIINGYMESDYDLRWDGRPFFQLMRALYDKYMFKEYMHRWEFIMRDHVNQLYAHIQRYFNVYSTHGMKTEPNSIALHD